MTTINALKNCSNEKEFAEIFSFVSQSKRLPDKKNVSIALTETAERIFGDKPNELFHPVREWANSIKE